MAKYLVSDVATTLLASGISSGATSLTVTAGAGALFPQPNTSTGTKFLATLVSASNVNTKEVVTCTARSTDTMTITPTTQAWNAGDTFAILNLAEMLEQLVQFDDLQAQLGNYAIDTGSANAYSVTLTPALSAHVVGMPIRWLAAHTNTESSTFNDGAGSGALNLPGGVSLPAGTVIGGVIYESIWNGGAFQLEGVIFSSFSQLSGQVSNSQVPQSAVVQFVAAILANAALTGTPTAPTATGGTQNTQIASTAFVQAAANAAAAATIAGASLTSPGYLALSNGWIVQGGLVALGSIASGATASATGDFYQPFPHGVLWIASEVYDSNGGLGSVVYNRTAVTADSVTYGAHNVIESYTANITINYIVVGW
jgi:hypothetical protein